MVTTSHMPNPKIILLVYITESIFNPGVIEVLDRPLNVPNIWIKFVLVILKFQHFSSQHS